MIDLDEIQDIRERLKQIKIHNVAEENKEAFEDLIADVLADITDEDIKKALEEKR